MFGVSLYGEPYIFGIAPSAIEAFVNLRKLELVSDLGPTDLTRRYLIRIDGTAMPGNVSPRSIVTDKVLADRQPFQTMSRAFYGHTHRI